MGSKGKLSIIVLVHNNVSMTMQCLEALADAVTLMDHELIVLDNGSTESTQRLYDRFRRFRTAKMIRSDTNLTFSTGNNRCVRESTGEFLLFLNNDVFVRPSSDIGSLLSPLLEEDCVGATGGKMLFPGSNTIQSAGISQMLWTHPSNYGVGGDPLDGRFTQRCERFALSGAMLCTRRDTFERVGGFDERYIWGTEDIDICLKIRAAGLKVLYCPEAEAIHRESATLKAKPVSDLQSNCRIYRSVWRRILVPAEQRYLQSLRRQGIRRVAIFGTGVAARGMAQILDGSGIEIEGFTSTTVRTSGDTFLDRPLLPLELLSKRSYDRLMVASQYFFELERLLCRHDPENEPIYPVLN